MGLGILRTSCRLLLRLTTMVMLPMMMMMMTLKRNKPGNLQIRCLQEESRRRQHTFGDVGSVPSCWKCRATVGTDNRVDGVGVVGRQIVDCWFVCCCWFCCCCCRRADTVPRSVNTRDSLVSTVVVVCCCCRRCCSGTYTSPRIGEGWNRFEKWSGCCCHRQRIVDRLMLLLLLLLLLFAATTQQGGKQWTHCRFQ